MRWLIGLLLLIISCVPGLTKTFPTAPSVSHTLTDCYNSVSELRKELPNHRVFYETIAGKRCYHVHVKPIFKSLIPQDWRPIFNSSRAQDFWDYNKREKIYLGPSDDNTRHRRE